MKSSHDFSQAGLLSLALLAFTAVVLIGQRLAARAPSFALVSGKAARPAALEPRAGARLLLVGAALFAVLACVLPIAAIVVQSLLRDPSDFGSWTFERYVQVFTRNPEGLAAAKNSVITSGLAALAATALGLVIAYGAARLRLRPSRVLAEAWNVGYALPGTVIALALLVFYSGTLTDTLWILSLAYLAKYAAFALRTLIPATGAIGRELEEAAWICGASPRKAFFRVLVPMLRPALAASAVLAAVPMLSELTMSVLLVGAGTETLGSLIYKFQEYADPGSASVLAVSVAAAVLALNALIERLSRGAFGI